MNSGRSIALRLVSVVVVLALSCFGTMAAAAPPFKIGYCISLTGVYKSLGIDMRDGLNLYMEEIGHKAGGRDIEVLVKNIASNTVTLALDSAFDLIEKNKVDVIAGVVDSGCAYALAELVEKHDVPFVISNAGADDLTQRKASPLIVRVSFTSSGGSHPLGSWAFEQGFRKAVTIGAGNAAGYEQIGGICNTFTKMGGRIVQELWPPLGTQDFKPILAQIKPDADVAFVFLAGGDAIRFVQQFASSPLKERLPIVAKGDLVEPNVLAQVGKSADGVVNVTHWSPSVDTPENSRFKSAFAKKYGRAPSHFAEQGYVTGMVIAEALKKAKGEIKGKDLVRVMRSIELKAPRGTIRFDEFGAPIQNYYIGKIQLSDGQWQNTIIKTFPSLSQFWTWNPQEFMAKPSYIEMKGKWVTSGP